MADIQSKIQQLEFAYAQFSFRSNSNGRRRLWLKISKMLRNGVKIMKAIESIRQRQVDAGKEKSPECIALEAWADGLRNGLRLSAVIGGWVTAEEMMVLSAGEQSGTLQESLISAADILSARKKITKAIVSGVAYPILLAMMGFGVLYLFGYKIVPAFTKIARGADNWTGSAKAMVHVSLFARDWLWLIAILAIVGCIAFYMSLSRFDGQMRIRLDRYAPYSIYRILLGSTWLISIAALVRASTRIENAMEMQIQYAGPWLQTRLEATLSLMRSGVNIGEALMQTGYEFPDREIIDDLGIYAALSGFDEALDILGREWLETSVEEIQAKMNIVFGASMLIVGLIIALMVTGLMDMQGQLSGMIQAPR